MKEPIDVPIAPVGQVRSRARQVRSYGFGKNVDAHDRMPTGYRHLRQLTRDNGKQPLQGNRKLIFALTFW